MGLRRQQPASRHPSAVVQRARSEHPVLVADTRMPSASSTLRLVSRRQGRPASRRSIVKRGEAGLPGQLRLAHHLRLAKALDVVDRHATPPEIAPRATCARPPDCAIASIGERLWGLEAEPARARTSAAGAARSGRSQPQPRARPMRARDGPRADRAADSAPWRRLHVDAGGRRAAKSRSHATRTRRSRAAATPMLVLLGAARPGASAAPGACPGAQLVCRRAARHRRRARARSSSAPTSCSQTAAATRPSSRCCCAASASAPREQRARRLQGRELRRAVGERPIVAASPRDDRAARDTRARRALIAAACCCTASAAPARRASHARCTRSRRAAREPFVALACAELRRAELDDRAVRAPRRARRAPRGRACCWTPTAARCSSTTSTRCPPRSSDRLARRAATRRAAAGPRAASRERLDLRVLAATSADLAQRVAAGRFRQDLYERIATLALEVPPLRARGLDLPLLLDHCVAQACRRSNRARSWSARRRSRAWSPTPGPATCASSSSALARAVARAQGERLGLEHLPAEVVNPHAGRAARAGAAPRAQALRGRADPARPARHRRQPHARRAPARRSATARCSTS